MYSMNYKEGLIYKIICKTDDKICYIGSTYNILSQRWRDHKKNYDLWINNKKKEKCSIYPYFEKYGIENFKMIEIKKYKVCAENIRDKKHLSVYELLHILKHKNCVNELKPFNPLKNLDNKIYKNNYYQENIDKYKEKNKNYRENNKEKLKDYDKNYKEKNKDKIKEQKKNRYNQNKEKINEKMKKKVECVCGSKIRKVDLNRHLKSKKHQNYINNNN